MYKGVIFDLDGTISDSIPDLMFAMNRMLKNRALPIRNRDDILGAINHGGYECVKKSLPEKYRQDDLFIKDCLNEYESYYAERFCVDSKPFDGVFEVFKALNAQNVKIAVLSNKRDSLVKDIVTTLYKGIKFDILQGQIEGIPTKPDPQGALLIAKNLGLDLNDLALVGDTDVDITTAIRAGIKPIGVLWGYRSREIMENAGCRIFAKNGDELTKILLS